MHPGKAGATNQGVLSMLSKITRRGIVVAVGACMLAGVLGGCVNQQEYDRLVETNRSLSATNSDLQAQLDDCNRLVGTLRGQTGSASDTIVSLQQANDDLRRQLADVQAQYEQLESEMASMPLTRLDPVTDRALRDLAAKNPGLLSYDPDRGMLRFSSDLTFDSGSAVVRAEAAETLRALAGILNSAEAAPYDVRIVGHTDSQPISANTAKRHPTNMHLSVHRAIAVREELRKLGVSAARMEAAGWGEFRPAVPNAPDGNTPRNRRVEVFLVRGAAASAGAESPGTGSVPVDRARGTGGIEPIK